MRKDYILPIIIFIPLLIAQITLVPLISIDYFAPDLLIIVLVYYTLINGQFFGTFAGALIGLTFDLASGNLIGLSMFSKTIAGFVAGYFFNENKIETNTSTITFSFIIFLTSFVDSFFNGLFSDTQGVGIIFILFERSLFPAIYTAIISMLLIIVLPKRKFL
jgi:rod shape-determining protein MreD